MNSANEPRPYEDILPERKSRKGLWILGILLVLVFLLGTCIKGSIDAFAAVRARNEATRELAIEFMRDGLPDVSDPIYAKRGQANQKAIDDLNDLIEIYGKTTKYSEATCGMVTSANTDASKAGTFSSCTLTAQARRSNVAISVDWVREDQAWKIMDFNVNYSNDAPYLERNQTDAEAPAAEPDPVTE